MPQRLLILLASAYIFADGNPEDPRAAELEWFDVTGAAIRAADLQHGIGKDRHGRRHRLAAHRGLLRPAEPRQVGRWEVPRDEIKEYQVDFLSVIPQRYLHDVYVADGLAYLAFWRDGLVILDVGNGIKGGSVTEPKLVSRFVYNHAQLYPRGYHAGTHAVFPYGDYVFIADESYSGTVNLFSREQFPTRGRMHVIDVSDLEHPVKVAEYDPVEFGVHNIYAADDLLYIGGYNGGIRLLDISGELRGDLRAQGRVIGSLYTGSLDGFRPNMALAWSAIPHQGFIFASDINTGLWVAKVTPAPVP